MSEDIKNKEQYIRELEEKQRELEENQICGIKLRVFFGEENFNRLYNKYLDSIEDGIEGGKIAAANDDNRITKFIENQRKYEDMEEINNYWKNQQGDFFRLLNRYTELLGEEARKRFRASVITANSSDKAITNTKENDSDNLHCFFELIQNADDCEYENESRKFTIDFSDISEENTITVNYNEKGMTYTDIIALSAINESTKAKNTKQIGEKGQGFKTIFDLCDWVEIDSGGYSFRYDCKLGNGEADIDIKPKEPAGNGKGTRIVMHLRGNNNNACDRLLKKYGFDGTLDNQKAFLNCPIMFTNHLNSLCIIENKDSVYEISNLLGKDYEYTLCYKHNDDDKGLSIDYIRYEDTVTFSEEEWKSRFKDKVPYAPDEYKIYIAAPKDAKGSKISKGRLYTFLPTEQIINSPVNIHFPAFLESSRSTFELGDNNEHILWNQRLVKDFFAEDGWYVKFFDLMKTKVPSEELINYLPSGKDFFDESKLEDLFNYYRNISYNMGDTITGKEKETDIYRRLKIFRSVDNQWRTGSEIWMPDDFAEKFAEAYFEEFQKFAGKKYRTPYCGEFINNNKLKDLTEYEEIILDGKKLVAILNNIMDDTVREQIIEYIFFDKNTSIYIPKYRGNENDEKDREARENLLNLKVFKRIELDSSDKMTGEYCTADINEAVWVYEYEFFGKGTPPFDSFIRVCLCDFKNIFKELKVVGDYKLASLTANRREPELIKKTGVFKYIIDKTTELSLKKDKHFKDILSCYAILEKSEPDWYEFGKTLLTEKKYTNSTEWTTVLAKLMQLAEDLDESSDPDFESKKYTLLVLASRGKVFKETVHINIPICQWSDELMDIVIETDNDDGYKDKNNIEINHGININRRSNIFNADKYQKYDVFKGLIVYVDHAALPEGRDFFHYNKTVVLRSTDEEVIEAAADSLLQGIGENQACVRVINQILESESGDIPFSCREDAEKLGRPLQKHLTYEYLFSRRGKNSNPGERDYGDNVIAYELVQNANDCRIRSENRSEELGEHKTLNINFCKDTISIDPVIYIASLSYPDMGFSPKDLDALCVDENSGNTDRSSGTTGKKGTGFKSIFKEFHEVNIASNYFKITLSTNKHPIYSIGNNSITVEDDMIPYKKEGDEGCEEKDEPIAIPPIPSFSFEHARLVNYFKQPITSLTMRTDNKDSIDNLRNDLKDFKTYLFTDSFNEISVPYSDNYLNKGKRVETAQIERKYDGNIFKISAYRMSYNFFRYTDEYDTNKTVTVLFPTKETIKDLGNSGNGRSTNPTIYCTLPLQEYEISDDEKLCFFVNVDPSVSLNPSRKELLPGSNYCAGDFYYIVNGIFRAFDAFAKENPQIAYNNYPVGDFYDKLNKLYIDSQPQKYGKKPLFFNDRKFIPVKGGELISFNDFNKSAYMLDYKEKADFIGFLELYLSLFSKPRLIGKILLMHYKKYTGEDDCTPNTPIQTVINTDEEIAGYSNLSAVENKLAKAFGINKVNFEIDADMFNKNNVRSTLYTDNKMDKFAEEAITNYRTQLGDLFDVSSMLHWDNSYLKIFGEDTLKEFSNRSIDKTSYKITAEPFMYFDDGSSLPEDLMDMFEKYKNCNSEDISVNELIEHQNAITIIKYAIYYESKIFLRFWSADDRLVIFGKSGFKSILEDLFGLRSEEKSIDLPEPIYSLPKVRGYGFFDELTDKELFVAAAESFPLDVDLLNTDNDEGKTALLRRTDFRFTDSAGKKHSYSWKGYGAEIFGEDTVCPVCHNELFSTLDALKIYMVGAAELPLIMCKSCTEYYKESENVYVCEYSEDKTKDLTKLKCGCGSGSICDYITEHSDITLELNVRFEGEDTIRKRYKDVHLSTPHRLLIYKLFNDEEE